MHRDELRDALDAMASAIPAPAGDARTAMTRGRRRVRQRRLSFAGVVALLAAIVVVAAAIARTGDGESRVQSVPTTVHSVEVVPRTTATAPPASDAPEQPIPIPLAFVSPTEGWVCSTPNMEYTTDAGATWRNVPVPSHPASAPSYQFPVCAAVPGGEAWMVDREQVIHYTEGGRHVETNAFPRLPADYSVDEVAFADNRNGWAVARDHTGDGATALLTRDGGRTWMLGGNSLGVPRFSTPTDGWVGADSSGELAHTTDAGFTWQDVAVPTPDAVPGLPVGLETPALVGETVVVPGSSRTGNFTSLFFDVSTDFGRTWTMHQSQPGPVNATKPRAFGAIDGTHWQLALENRLWTTDDGGDSWTAVAEFAGISAITDVRFVTPEIGFVSVSGGTKDTYATTEVLQTADGGGTWSTVAVRAPRMRDNGPINFPGGIIGCPTQPLATPPPGNPPAGLLDAAAHRVEQGPNGWTPTNWLHVYRLGENPEGSFGFLFEYQVGSCGAPTMANGWVVEISGTVTDRGYIPRAELVLAYSPDGWHVFGRYH
jgi:photosystem II stability/assembly factor-like uncharacterized protein